MADPDMQNIDLTPAPTSAEETNPPPATATTTTIPIVEPPVTKNANGVPAMGFVPLVTVVGFHHARCVFSDIRKRVMSRPKLTIQPEVPKSKVGSEQKTVLIPP